MIRAATLSADVDLRPLLAAMARQGIRFRVNEESGAQVIRVATEADAELTAVLLAQWQQILRDGEGAVNSAPLNGRLAGYFPIGNYAADLMRAFFSAPVTILLIAAALVVAAMSQLGSNLQPVAGLFYPNLLPRFTSDLAGFAAVLRQINSVVELMRTLSPALLHFGAIHLVFNTLWLWHFGRMIEGAQSSLRYLVVILLIAFVSNTAQYLWSQSTNFGGLSGVVYGLLGYIWMWQTLVPGGRLRLPPAMIGFLLVALVLMEIFASAWIATAAHAGGLIAGMLAGLAAGVLNRINSH